MKKMAVLLFALALSMTAHTGLLAQGKVLLILKDGSEAMDLMLRNEVGVMVSMLKDAGYWPVTATMSGKVLQGREISLTPDIKLSEVNTSDYVGIIIPCMALGMGAGITDDALRIVIEANNLDLPIAAEQGGVGFLARAGLLKNRHFTVTKGYEYIAPDGFYDGTEIAKDGKLITASTCPYQATESKPATTAKLTSAFIKELQTNAE